MSQCSVESLYYSRACRVQSIIIQNSSNPSSRKKFGCTTVQGATFNMRGNCTTGTPTSRLCPVVQWSEHWALSWTTQVLVLARARRYALEMCGENKCKLHFQAWLNLYIITVLLHSIDTLVSLVCVKIQRMLTSLYLFHLRVTSI